MSHVFVINGVQPGTGMLLPGETVQPTLDEQDVLPMPPPLFTNADDSPDGIVRMIEGDEAVARENRRRLENPSSVDDYWAKSVPPVIQNTMTDEAEYFKPPVDNSPMDPDDILPSLTVMEW